MSGLRPHSSKPNFEPSTNQVPDWYKGVWYDMTGQQQRHQQSLGSEMYTQASQGPYARPTVPSNTRVRQQSGSGSVSSRTGQNIQASQGPFRSMPKHTSSQIFHQQPSAQTSIQQQQAGLPPYHFVTTQAGTDDMLIGARIAEQQHYRAPDVMQASHPNLAKNVQPNEIPIQRFEVNSSHRPQDISHRSQMLGGKNTTAQELSATYQSQQNTFLTNPILEGQQQAQQVYDDNILYQRHQSSHRRNQGYSNDPGNRTHQNHYYNVQQVQQPFLSEQRPYHSGPQLAGGQKAPNVPSYPQTSVSMPSYAHAPRNMPANAEALLNLAMYSQVNSQPSLNMPVYTQGLRSVSVQPPHYNNHYSFSRPNQDLAAAELNIHNVMAGYARSQIRQRNREKSESTTQEDLSKIRSVFSIPRSSEEPSDRSLLQKWYAEPSTNVPEAPMSPEPPVLEPAVLPPANVDKDLSENCNQNLTPTIVNDNVIEYKVLDLINCFDVEQSSTAKTSRDEENPSRIVDEQQETNVGTEQKGSDIIIAPVQIDFSPVDGAESQPICSNILSEEVTNTQAANIGPAVVDEDSNLSTDLQSATKGIKRKATDEHITAEKCRKVEEEAKEEKHQIGFGFEERQRGRGRRRGRGRGRGRGRVKLETGFGGMTTSLKLVVNSSLWGGSRRGRGRGRKRGIGQGAVTLKQPPESSVKGVSRGRGRPRLTGTGKGAAASLKQTLDGSKRGGSRGRGRGRKPGLGQRRGRGKFAILHQTLDSVLMQEDPDVDALTAHLNMYTEDALTKKTISLKSLRHCLNKMKGKLKVPEKLKGKRENLEGEICDTTQDNVEKEAGAKDGKCDPVSDTKEPENNNVSKDGSDSACDLNKECVKEKNVFVDFATCGEVSNIVADGDIQRFENSNCTRNMYNHECGGASDLNKGKKGRGNKYIEKTVNDNGIAGSTSCKNTRSPGKANISCNTDVEVISEIDKKKRSDIEENTDYGSKQSVDDKSDGNMDIGISSENDGNNEGKQKGHLKSPNPVKKDADKTSECEMTHTFDEAHKATIVRFHNKTVLLLSTEKGNFFLMKELLKRCFCKDITDKEEILKTKRNTLLIKEKQLNIPFKAMDKIFYSFVKKYFLKRKISRTLHSEVSVISEEDANRLFHVIYKEKYCTNGCIVTDARNKPKTVQQTGSSGAITDIYTSTSQAEGTVQNLCQASLQSNVGSTHDLENNLVNEVEKDHNVREPMKDKNVFQWISQETCKLPKLKKSKAKEGDDDNDYDSDATYAYQEEGDQIIDELNDSKKNSDVMDGSGNTDICNSKSANMTTDIDLTDTFEVYKENKLVGVFKANSPTQLVCDDDSKTVNEVVPRKIKAEGMRSDSFVHVTESLDDAVIDLTEVFDDCSADSQEGNSTEETVTKNHSSELMNINQNINNNDPGEHDSLGIKENPQTGPVAGRSSTSNTQSSVESCDERFNIKVAHLLQDYTIDDDDVMEIQITSDNLLQTNDTVVHTPNVNEQEMTSSSEIITSDKDDVRIEHGSPACKTTEDCSALGNSRSETDVPLVKSPHKTTHGENQDREPDIETEKDVEADKSSDTEFTISKENSCSSVIVQKEAKDKSVANGVKVSESKTKVSSEERANINDSVAEAQKHLHEFLDDTTIVQSAAFISKAEETLQDCIYKANATRKDEKSKEMKTDLYRELNNLSKPVIEWSLRFVNMYKKSFEMAKDDSMLRDLEEIEQTYTDLNFC